MMSWKNLYDSVVVFWQSGILLRNQMNSRLLLASREVENRNEVFIQWSLREDLSWKRYSEDEYKNLALGNGIGGWDGIQNYMIL